MDNLQPVLLHEANGGGDWKEHGVTKAQIMTVGKRRRDVAQRNYLRSSKI